MRLVRQVDFSECGLSCVAMIARHHGLKIDLGTLRRRFLPSMRGTPLKALLTDVSKLGLLGRAVAVEPRYTSELRLPAMLHWNKNHYVVLERIRRGKFIIHDPASTTRSLSLEQLSRHYHGIAVEFTPGPDFQTGNYENNLQLRELWVHVSQYKWRILALFILTIFLLGSALLSPLYLQWAIDKAIPNNDRSYLRMLAAGFAGLAAFTVVISLTRSLILVKIGLGMSANLSSFMAQHLFKLPVGWFARRHTGDILSRFQAIVPVQRFLMQGATSAILDGILAVTTGAMMIAYSPMLSAIGFGSFLLYVGVRICTFRLERDAQETSISLHGIEQSALIEGIRGITTLRLFGHEMRQMEKWQASLFKALDADNKYGKISIAQGHANQIIGGLEAVVTIWLAVEMVIAAQFSTGMLFAFLAYKSQFTGKATSLIDQFVAFRMLELHLSRLADISKSETDMSFAADIIQLPVSFTGQLVLEDISYRYSNSDPDIFSGLTLSVAAGDHIAITGASGAGKSTLINIMLGLTDPIQGRVLVDGMPLKQFGYRAYRSQVAAVLQSDHLFAGSIAENISFFEDGGNQHRIEVAAKNAEIHAEIMQMPMAYKTLVGDMGSTLSGGQKQRVLLARAFYKKPALLVLDEATSHLDSKTELKINARIRKLGITRIIIAHRKETIRTADKIYMLDDGTLRTKLD